MQEVFINVKGIELENLFDVDLISVDDLVSKTIDLMYDNKEKEEKIEELNEKLQDVKPINIYASLGINESDYH